MPLSPSNRHQPESDGALAAMAARGDQGAFVALYDRYFAEAYDFLLRLLLSRPKAASAVLSTFLSFRRRLSSGLRQESLRLQALAAAYRAAMEEGEPPGASTAGEGEAQEEPATFAQVDAGRFRSPEEAALAQEEAPIVWEVAAGVNRREYVLLDLRLRRGLGATQVGRVVGMGRIGVWRIVSRLARAANEAFSSRLMVRMGIDQCEALKGLAAGMDKAILPPESRRLVSDHVAACPVCSETRRTLVPPLEVLAALLPVSPPPGLKEAVLRNVLAQTALGAGAAVATAAPATAALPRPRSMGPPPAFPPRTRVGAAPGGGPAFAVMAGAAAALALPVIALALWLAVLSGGDSGGSASAGPTSTPVGAGAALEGCDSTAASVTCTPTATETETPTPAAATATVESTPSGTPTPSPTATAGALPTETPSPTPETTPAGTGTPISETPTGFVETATPEPSPGRTPTTAPGATPALSSSPGPPLPE